ncbi:hypothetical protein [Sphingopyxis macrogoltabida]|uniref:hypothetical protein n=1 Tax=Sphingopyxis macrogoltabida TaxID=33050 RepID=UPI000AC8BB95|nr:hypothetical protein [Sphingopyxis macrogoltabida]
MPITTDLAPGLSGQTLAIYAVGAALILFILFKIPYVGRVIRALFLVRAARFRYLPHPSAGALRPQSVAHHREAGARPSGGRW